MKNKKPNYSIQILLGITLLITLLFREFLSKGDKMGVIICGLLFIGFTVYNFYLEEQK